MKVARNVIFCFKKTTCLPQTLFNFSVLTIAKRCPVFRGSDFSPQIKDLATFGCVLLKGDI